MQHVRHEENHDEEHRHRVALHFVILRQILLRQEEREDGRAVQRRDGQQVEEHEVQVDERKHGKEQREEVVEDVVLRQRAHRQHEHDERVHDCAQDGQHEVGRRPGEAHDEVALARVLEVSGIIRHRLRVAEHGHVHGHEQKRHDDRAEGVDVLERVERQPSRALSRGIAQLVGGEAVARLVAHDGGHEAQNGAYEVGYRNHSAISLPQPQRATCAGRETSQGANAAKPDSACGNASSLQKHASVAEACFWSEDARRQRRWKTFSRRSCRASPAFSAEQAFRRGTGSARPGAHGTLRA